MAEFVASGSHERHRHRRARHADVDTKRLFDGTKAWCAHTHEWVMTARCPCPLSVLVSAAVARCRLGSRSTGNGKRETGHKHQGGRFSADQRNARERGGLELRGSVNGDVIYAHLRSMRNGACSLIHDRLTYSVIGAFFEVYHTLDLVFWSLSMLRRYARASWSWASHRSEVPFRC